MLDRTRVRLDKPLTLTAPCLSHGTDNEFAAGLLAMTGKFTTRSVLFPCCCEMTSSDAVWAFRADRG